MDLWYPGAERAPVPGHAGGSGKMLACSPKVTHHSTEGSSIDGALATYAETGDLPHFTDTFEHGRYEAWQHLPLDVAGSALEHRDGDPDTNRANAIQIEHVGFAATSSAWPDGYLAGIARLCRWIEAQTGCNRSCGLSFSPGAKRLSWPGWRAYNGHLGHMHVPGQNHTDPGAMNIARILDRTPAPLPKEDAMLVPVIDPKATPVKGRIPNWETDEDGNMYAWNGARDLPPLSKIAPVHAPIVGIALEPGGDGVVLFANDRTQDASGAWVRSTYKITVGM